MTHVAKAVIAVVAVLKHLVELEERHLDPSNYYCFHHHQMMMVAELGLMTAALVVVVVVARIAVVVVVASWTVDFVEIEMNVVLQEKVEVVDNGLSIAIHGSTAVELAGNP